ncbi:MAG TPA: sigma factor [Clostridiaceae bacterium]
MNYNSRILKAKSGDMEAFYELIQDKKESLYKIAYAYTKNEEDAVDTISETVYRAFKNIGKLKSPEYFNTWITRILINCAIDLTRKRTATVFVDEFKLDIDTFEYLIIEKELLLSH